MCVCMHMSMEDLLSPQKKKSDRIESPREPGKYLSVAIGTCTDKRVRAYVYVYAYIAAAM